MDKALADTRKMPSLLSFFLSSPSSPSSIPYLPDVRAEPGT